MRLFSKASEESAKLLSDKVGGDGHMGILFGRGRSRSRPTQVRYVLHDCRGEVGTCRSAWKVRCEVNKRFLHRIEGRELHSRNFSGARSIGQSLHARRPQIVGRREGEDSIEIGSDCLPGGQGRTHRRKLFAQRGSDRRMIIGNIARGTQNRALRDIGRDDHRRHAHAVTIEVEGGRGRGRGGCGGRRRNVVVTAAMLVIENHQQGLRPGRPGAQAVVDIGDQLLPQRDHMRRMLVIGRMQNGEIARLDEGITWQAAAAGILAKFLVITKVIRQQPQFRQRVRERNVVVIDLPTP